MRQAVFGLLFAGLFAWSGPAPARADAFDHSPFDTLLRKHVVAGMVDYDAAPR